MKSEKEVEKKESDIDVITSLLDVIDNVDIKQVEKLASIDDTELKRSNIAKHIIDVAHKLNALKSVHSVSTMRELLYSLIAVETKKSIALHKECEAKASDTLKDIKASANACLVFSSLYRKEFDKRFKA